jgi:hypothetical protein
MMMMIMVVMVVMRTASSLSLFFRHNAISPDLGSATAEF